MVAGGRRRTAGTLLGVFVAGAVAVTVLGLFMGDGAELQSVMVCAQCRAELAGALRDPSSLTIEDMSIEQGENEPHGWVAIGTYRARNGFGGMNSDVFMCTADADGANTEVLPGESLDE